MHAVTFRVLHPVSPQLFAVPFAQAKEAGADTICLVDHHYALLDGNEVQQAGWAPHRYLWRDELQMPNAQGNSTPRTVLQEVIELAAFDYELNVILKPHIDPFYRTGPGGWRFYISVKNVYGQGRPYDHSTVWRKAYWRFLKPYVKLASDYGTGLVLGCELGSVTRELGAAFWLDMAAKVRGTGFGGLLTYASNWNQEVEFLDALWESPAITHLGVDWYTPAVQWDDHAAALRAQAARVGKPILFTEAGAANYAGCADEPGADPPPGASPDDGAQLAWWQHFVATWPGADRLAWEGPLVGLAQPGVSHQLLGRPAAAVALGPG